MTTNNNKHIITNKIKWIRQLLFPHITFLSSSEASIVFNISSLYSNTNFGTRHFLEEQFLTSKYLSILHALFHS